MGTSDCRTEEHSYDDESPAVSRPSVEESGISPKVILRLDNKNMLTHTSDTQRKAWAGDGIENFTGDIEGHTSDSGSDNNGDAGPKQHGATERRRAQNARFNAWLATRAERVTKEEVRAAVASADDDQLSIRSLMSKQESTVIITDPREYQVELFEKAKKQNIIAVLDTGSGKTLIAVLLLRFVLDQELEDRALGKRRRIAFFLVDCVTLVFQQFAVLECNLDQKVERFCGDMGCDLWKKEEWEKHFKENMVIVCTVEVLYNCLMHSFITIDQISLLIFDEAHHAKKNHGYARIIKDFYLTENDPTKRPKIFGMTASPVDARVDVVQAAKELEMLLHSQIATTSDLSLLRMSISRPDESIAVYGELLPPYDTSFCAEMKSRFRDLGGLSKLFQFAREASSQLGEWCADQLWSFGLADDEARKVERKAERLFLAEKEARPIEVLDAEVAQLREAMSMVKQHIFVPPTTSDNSISSKVLLLQRYLQLVFEKPSDAKCIVFVKRRYTARLLGELFARIGTPHLRLGILIGTRQGEAGDVKVTFRQQVVTLMKFRKGDINCLFATSIAEEGLDIPDCNLIVRFDLYDTLIQYIQSRGRARHMNSKACYVYCNQSSVANTNKYIHMIEAGNKTHIQAIKDVRSGEEVMRQFCEALPADRLLQGNDCNLEGALAKDRLLITFTEPLTGAKLTYGSSLPVLAHFVGCLPHDSETTLQPMYIMAVENKQYICEVILPQNSPIRSAIGRPSSRKAIAKRSAAFEACMLLRKGEYLDAHLLPTYHKQLPAMRNALLALNMKKSNAYDMRIKPDLWEETRGGIPQVLYLTILELESPEGIGRPCQPLALMTRTSLPAIPPFLLHLNSGQSSQVLCTSVTYSLPVTALSLEKLTSFTLRIFKDIFAKVYEVNPAQMSYWLAPIMRSRCKDSAPEHPDALLDWPTLDLVHSHDELPWTIEIPHSQLANRFLVDRWDGGRRFFSVGVVPGMHALDPVPPDSAPGKYMLNILDYSVSLFAKSRARATWRHDQPVIQAHRILHRRNWLDKIDEKEKEQKTLAFVCPEPLRISALPTDVVAMAYIFPAIISRLESYLIVLEACRMLNLDVKSDLALEAFTKDSDNTEEHRDERIHYQRGMGKNYERLEFLGDCFLKMATSISLFSQNPDNDEFEYHVKRMLLICNKNLYTTAVKTKLYEYIRSQSFSRRTWYPEGLKLLEGKGHKKIGKEVVKHHLGDKTIADVCEAVIGAALLSQDGTANMDMAVKAVTALVASPDHDVSRWNDYYTLYTKPIYQLAQASASQLDLAAKVEQKHDYHFKYPRLLRSAFVHPSYPFSWEKVPCYQRLEFLGDSLLDMACINFLFYRYPERDPQWLTEHKMAMVSNRFLGALCAKLGFHKHLRYNSSLIEFQIRDYVTEIEEAEQESNGARDYWTAVKNPPKCLPDVVEAYIGAIFVDSEFDYLQVERFFKMHIEWFFVDMSIYDTFANNHPTTYLNNLLTLTFGCTNYRVMANELPSIDGSPIRVVAAVMIHNDIMAEGTASSGKYAKVKASSNALDLLKGLAPFEFRMQYRCDCTKEAQEDEVLGTPIEEVVGSAV